MDIGFDILEVIKWLKDIFLKNVDRRLNFLEGKVAQLEADIADMNKLIGQTMDKLSKLEGKYENAVETFLTKLENNVLKRKMIAQEHKIRKLRLLIAGDKRTGRKER